MTSTSRTINSAKNASIAFIFYIVSLVIQFISRKVFIEYLGSEILGLNSTATSLLSFLNMAEMGIGTAVAFTLYKPISENDRQSIAEIISVQGWLYKRIGFFVLISGIILSFFFPLIFKKTDLPLWYAYATFGVLLFAAMLTYMFNYKQILLSAHQLEYKVTIAYKLPKTIKDIIQIVCIWKIPEYGYQLWVIWEGIGAIWCCISLRYAVNKEFPYIKKLKLDGGSLRKKYSIILTKVKQLLFHKVSAFILFQTSPLIIYAFTDLSLVAIYGNYMLIVTGVTMLLSTLYNGMSASVGNAVQQCDDKRIISLFKEIYVLRFYLVVCACFAYLKCVNPIMRLWIGDGYLLESSSVCLIVLNMFINCTRPPIELFLQAKGMFQDIWAPVVEGILNLGLSILLGHFWGLNGILAGINISLFIIPFCWKPYFLFKGGFNKPISIYVFTIIKLVSIAVLNFIVWCSIEYFMHNAISENYHLAFQTLISLGFAISIFISLYFIKDGLRNITKRIKTLILKK